MKTDIQTELTQALLPHEKVWANEEKTILAKNILLDLVEKTDPTIIGLLLNNDELKRHFFVEVNGVLVFKLQDLRFFLDKHSVNNSYTKYANRIGLTDGNRFLKDNSDIVLDFPFKDCVLNGGQSTELQTDIIVSQSKNGISLYKKQRPELDDLPTKKPKTIFYKPEYSSGNGTEQMKNLFGEKAFKNPKPEELIQDFITITTNESDIVLDYHLGSGTTAAVAHKMNRQYIGIEQMDYIETLAVERLKKVIDGEQGGISKAVNWQGGGEFVYAELAPFNETAKQQILACEDSDGIKTLFEGLCERYFLKYNVSVNEFSQIIQEPEFQSLPLDEQKQMVLEMLDLNQMYVSLSEMDDEQFADCLNDDDKAVSRAFYQAEKKNGE